MALIELGIAAVATVDISRRLSAMWAASCAAAYDGKGLADGDALADDGALAAAGRIFMEKIGDLDRLSSGGCRLARPDYECGTGGPVR